MKFGQQGIAQVLIMTLVLGGVVAGIFVVQQGTDLFPEAKNNKIGKAFPMQAKKCLSDSECGAGYECQIKNKKPLPSQACKNGKNPNCVTVATNSAVTTSTDSGTIATNSASAAKREYGTCKKIEKGGGNGKIKEDKQQGGGNVKSPKPSKTPNSGEVEDELENESE